MLMKRDPANPAPAEDAYLTAIAVAKQQGDAQLRTPRGAGARQALSVHRSSRRRPRRPRACARRFFANAGNARDRRGGALLAVLAETDEVKATIGQRRRRNGCTSHTGTRSYMRAGTLPAKPRKHSHGATSSSFDDKAAPERLAAEYGVWVGGLLRGELPLIRRYAADISERRPSETDSPEAGVARRIAGTTHWFAGEYPEARDHLEQALAYVSSRARRRFGVPLRNRRRRRGDGLPRADVVVDG